MFEMIFFALVIMLIVGFFLFILPKKNNQKSVASAEDTPITAKQLMTEHEKTMFQALKLLPDCYVFSQVALGAILKTKSWKTRNKFAQKIADFVVTDPFFNVLAVIELDDKSHDQKKEQDQARDKMLQDAGYKVLRYRVIPSPEKLAQDILTK